MADPKIVDLARARELRTAANQVHPPHDRPLQHGGGRGTSGGGMETRIAVLEADMAHVKADLGELKADVRNLQTSVGDLRVSIGRLEERVAHLPTITMMWSAAVAIVVALGAVIALAVRFIPHAS